MTIKATWLIVALQGIFFFSLAGQTSWHSVTIHSGTRLRKIPVCLGEVNPLKKLIPGELRLQPHPDQVFFENVSVGRIPFCKLRYSFQQDTLQTITMYLSGQKNFDAARQQAQKQFGPSHYVRQGPEEFFSWTVKAKGRALIVSLYRKTIEWGSEMMIQFQRE